MLNKTNSQLFKKMEATSIECGTKQLVFQHVEAMKGKKKININQVK